MSVSRDVIANVNNVPIDYVKCNNCFYNAGFIVGDVINCSFWNNNDFSISKDKFCSFWADKKGDFVKILNERISESVCKYCQMNKHCELCEISRVFSIITLTAEEQKGGAK